jgi:hypothetical protein
VPTAGGQTSRSQPRAWTLPVSLQWGSETIDNAASDQGELVVETDEVITQSRSRALFLAKQPVVGLNGRMGTFVLEQLEEVGRDRTFVVGPSSNLQTLVAGLWWDDPPDDLLAPCDVDSYFVVTRSLRDPRHRPGGASRLC